MDFAEVWTVSYRLSGARPDLLNDLPTVRRALQDSAQATGLHVLSCAHHTFTPQGVSLALILAGGGWRLRHGDQLLTRQQGGRHGGRGRPHQGL